MRDLRITRAYRKAVEVVAPFIFHDRAAIDAVDAIRQSADANDYGEVVWVERDRVSQRTGGPYVERKLACNVQIGPGRRWMLAKVSGSGSVSWYSHDIDTSPWRLAEIPPFAEQPQDPPAEEDTAEFEPVKS